MLGSCSIEDEQIILAVKIFVIYNSIPDKSILHKSNWCNHHLHKPHMYMYI